VRIGKYKPKSGYKRHTGFRSSLTRIEVTGIGARKTPPKAESKPAAKVEEAPAAPKGLPKDYAEMTVAQIAEAAKSWNRPMLEAALAYEQEHAKRIALGAIEHAPQQKRAHGT
jgi:hypothetical protein